MCSGQQSARQREAAHLPPEPAFAEGEEFFGRYQRDEDDVARAAAAARRNPTDDLAADENDDMGTGYGVWHSSRKVQGFLMMHSLHYNIYLFVAKNVLETKTMK